MKGVRCTVYALGLGLSGLQFFFERGADEVTFGAGDPIVCVCVALHSVSVLPKSNPDN